MRCMFRDTCRVIGYAPETDRGITKFTPTVLYDRLPCAVDFRRSPAGAAERGAVEVSQEIRLYTLAKIVIPEGSTVEFEGKRYRMSGAGKRYPTHTEYDLVWRENA